LGVFVVALVPALVCTVVIKGNTAIVEMFLAVARVAHWHGLFNDFVFGRGRFPPRDRRRLAAGKDPVAALRAVKAPSTRSLPKARAWVRLLLARIRDADGADGMARLADVDGKQWVAEVLAKVKRGPRGFATFFDAWFTQKAYWAQPRHMLDPFEQWCELPSKKELQRDPTVLESALHTAARWFDFSGARAGPRRSPARPRKNGPASGSETDESEMEPTPVGARKASTTTPNCWFCEGAHRISACPQLAHLCTFCGEPQHEGDCAIARPCFLCWAQVPGPDGSDVEKQYVSLQTKVLEKHLMLAFMRRLP
jgi:hypothetical protein